MLRRDRDFRRYLLARLISSAGSEVTWIAFPALVYRMTGSGAWTAAMTAAEGIPYLLFGLVAGAVADRLDRRRMMILADLASALVIGSVPLTYALGSLTLGHVIVAGFAVQILNVFFDAANFGALPALVGRVRLAAAQSALTGAVKAAELVVPLLVGAALTVFFPSLLLIADALSFSASVVLILRVGRSLRPASRESKPLRSEIRQGLVFIWRDSLVRVQTVVGAAQCFAAGVLMGQLVPWADRALGVPSDDARLGVLYGMWGVGSLLGSVLFARSARRFGEPFVTLAFLPLAAVSGLAMGLTSVWWLAGGLIVVWGASFVAVALSSITMRQKLAPDHLQSRVSTTGRMLAYGVGAPLGAFTGGVVSVADGPAAAILVAGCVLALTWLMTLRSPLRTAHWSARPAVTDDPAVPVPVPRRTATASTSTSRATAPAVSAPPPARTASRPRPSALVPKGTAVPAIGDVPASPATDTENVPAGRVAGKYVRRC